MKPEEVAARKNKKMLAVKLANARSYLAQKRIHAYSWLAQHSKRAAVKGAVECGNKGWKELLFHLVNDETDAFPEKCPICSEMFTTAGFKMEDFKEAVENGPKTEDLEQAKEELVAFGDDGKDEDHKRSTDDGCPDDPEALLGDDFEPDSPDEGHHSGCQRPAATGAELSVVELIKRDPFVSLLPENTYKMRYPVICHICVRKATKKNSIFDLVDLRRTKYYYQHVEGPTHVGNMAEQLEKIRKKKEAAAAEGDGHQDGDGTMSEFAGFDPPKCEGFVVEREVNTKVNGLLAEFRLWFVYNCTGNVLKLQTDEDSRHNYTFDRGQQQHRIFHRLCTKQASSSGQPNSMCKKCRELGNDRPLQRCIGKFFVKYSAGRALNELPVGF